ncbi:MAG: DnaB-like helicase C-terminal domain-containing protein, partial [Clostridia bacterium]
YDIKKAKGLKSKLDKIREIEKRMKDGSLYIDDTSDNTVANMTLKAKQMQRKDGLDLIVVDYLQFVKASQKTNDRFQDVGGVARDLKVMARQLNVPVIALCQLNRKLDNENRTPTLADLRESGEIENNADIIMFLHSIDSKFKAIRNIDLIIGKFRNGQMKAIKMQYEGSIFKFKELEKLPEEHQQQQLDLKNETIELTPVEDDSLPF